MKICTPVMQAQYSPRRITGCGLTDGEVMERLWSYLRRMAKTTKEMRPSHRIDVLTSALLHYGDKSRQKLGKLTDDTLVVFMVFSLISDTATKEDEACQ